MGWREKAVIRERKERQADRETLSTGTTGEKINIVGR